MFSLSFTRLFLSLSLSASTYLVCLIPFEAFGGRKSLCSTRIPLLLQVPVHMDEPCASSMAFLCPSNASRMKSARFGGEQRQLRVVLCVLSLSPDFGGEKITKLPCPQNCSSISASQAISFYLVSLPPPTHPLEIFGFRCANAHVPRFVLLLAVAAFGRASNKGPSRGQ